MLQRSPLSEAAERILLNEKGLVKNFMGLSQEDKNICKATLKKLGLEPNNDNLEILLNVWKAGYNAIHEFSLPND